MAELTSDDSGSPLTNKEEEFAFIESADSAGGLIFEVDPIQEGTKEHISAFTPEFYPDRFTKTFNKKLDRSPKQCKGEDVSIQSLKNADIHASGVMLASEVITFQKIAKHRGKVDLITPISPKGGLEAYVKKGQLGEIEGYDPQNEEWQIKYTLDFVGTGKEEYGGNDTNAIVSNMLE